MRPLLFFLFALSISLQGAVLPESLPGLTAGPDGTVLKDGKPFRAIGINYFSCFLRTLKDANDRSYEQGFEILAKHHIPFVRFCATGYWPKDLALYRKNEAEYFRRLDAVVHSAEQNGIGLIPDLFWFYACVPDLVGEPIDQWANPQSKTHRWMHKYVKEVVTRYRNSPAIWAWEFGNEYNLQASLPNPEKHRPIIVPNEGTPKTRSARDETSFDTFRVAMTEFAKTVRELDPHRLIFSGDSFLRPSAWHQEHEGKWSKDTKEQFQEMVVRVNPDPINGVSVHAYGEDHQLFEWSLEAAQKMKKPFFVGEFGGPGATAEGTANFRSWLKAIEESSTPLAALWVFDLDRKSVV